ncbi:hypothetical protein [Shiella aurantiaca]|nr:hypothetical protein [Shiella aurantiaca]
MDAKSLKLEQEKLIKAIALDKFFKGNDQIRVDTVLLMKDARIEFITI